MATQQALQLDALIDWEEFLRFWAVEQWLCAPDSYNYNQNNYRVYFDKEDGKADFFPWDQDSIYYSAISLTSTRGVLSSNCQLDPDCMAHMYEEVDHVCDTVDEMGLDVLYNQITTLIQPYVEAGAVYEYLRPNDGKILDDELNFVIFIQEKVGKTKLLH